MAYSNGRIYVDTSVTPNIGVSIRDVQRALGVGSPDLGTLCTHPNINKWARYKPERHVGMNPISYATRKANFFGLQVPFCENDLMNNDVYYIINHIYNVWNYYNPRGGNTNEFYRLTDFVRFPQERTPSANGDPTPVNLQGYNHAAQIPFNAFIDMTGITDKGYSSDVGDEWYEINRQISNEIVITFINSIGDDLHLQDFIDLTWNTGNIAWRPVAQVFKHTSTTPYWYNKDRADKEVAGDVITNVQGDMFEVHIPLSTLNDNEYYHLCIGVGCCDQSNPLVWKTNNDSLFLLPYTSKQAEDGNFPFHYVFKIATYMSRKLKVTGLDFAELILPTWVAAGGQAPYFTIHELASGLIGITMTVTKYPGQALVFVNQNDTSHSNDYMKITAKETITGMQGTTTKYLTPSKGPNPSTGAPWSEESNGIAIPAGPDSETVTLYATMYIGDIPINGYGQYHLCADTGAGTMNDIGYFSIQKIQYSNS